MEIVWCLATGTLRAGKVRSSHCSQIKFREAERAETRIKRKRAGTSKAKGFCKVGEVR